MDVVDYRSAAWTDVPALLAGLHRCFAVDDLVRVRFPWPDGRAPDLSWVVDGAGFALTSSRPRQGEIDLQRLRTLPDVVGPGMRALVCGLNPSLVAADAGFGYAGATNRFWKAALSSHLVQVPRQPLEALRLDGVGMTDVVKRATARSHHLEPTEYRNGLQRLERIVTWLEPGVVIFVGLEGWRAAKDRKARPGWQNQVIGGHPAYVMPSTSGANARVSLPDLVSHLETALAGPV
jgi:TDG/mug DNA glycosylase family protein